MCAQRLGCGRILRKLALGQRRVDHAVAYRVQHHHGPSLAAAMLRHKVVAALRNTRRNLALAQCAHRQPALLGLGNGGQIVGF